MKARETAKLLGGYAAGTLTAEERAALFAAALDDQSLFDALADEEALRELLADPAARARLLASLDAARPAGTRAWWGLAMATAALVLMAVALVQTGRLPERATEIAQVRAAPVTAPVPEAAPAPAEVPRPEPKPAAKTPQRRAAPHAAPETPLTGETDAAPQPLRAPAAQPAATADNAAGAAPTQDEFPVRAAAPTMVRESLRAASSAGLARTSFAFMGGPPLTWKLLRGEGAERADAAPGSHTIETGEPVRVEITSPVRGWVHVLEPDGAGRWKLAASAEVGPEKPLRFPPGGPMRFSEPGVKVWLAVFGASPPASPPGKPPAEALRIAVEVVRP